MRTAPTGEEGQAATELVALLPVVVLVLAVVAQFVVAGHAFWSAHAAAAHAARAAAVHGDPRAAARAELPGWLRSGLRVSKRSGGGVRVAVQIPSIIGTGPLGTASAEGRFEGQS
jgi:pilus assembly protein CpaE